MFEDVCSGANEIAANLIIDTFAVCVIFQAFTNYEHMSARPRTHKNGIRVIESLCGGIRRGLDTPYRTYLCSLISYVERDFTFTQIPQYMADK